MGIANPKYENCVICSPSCCSKFLQGSTIRVLSAGPVGTVVQIYTDRANIITGNSTKNYALYIYSIHNINIKYLELKCIFSFNKWNRWLLIWAILFATLVSLFKSNELIQNTVLSTWAMSTKLASDDGGGYFMIILHASIQSIDVRRERSLALKSPSDVWVSYIIHIWFI